MDAAAYIAGVLDGSADAEEIAAAEAGPPKTNRALRRPPEPSTITESDLSDLAKLRSKLSMGADMERRDGSQSTPAMLAIGNNAPEALSLMLAMGCDPDQATPYGTTLSSMAAIRASLDCLRALAVHGADFAKLGKSPVDAAAARGWKEAADFISSRLSPPELPSGPAGAARVESRYGNWPALDMGERKMPKRLT